MGDYKALPFATYDLAVYLPGGAVLLVLIQYAFSTLLSQPIVPPVSVSGHSLVDDVVLAVLWLSGSYLAGHLGAFLSTYVVERFVHNALGYPSDVWIEKERTVGAGISARQTISGIFSRNVRQFRWDFVSIITMVFLFPAWPFFILFLMFKPVGFYTPKLPDHIQNDVMDAFKKTRSSVEVGEGTRWEKVVEHYVANNCPPAYMRMYNYLVIYGALRLLSFIMLVACWVILLKSVAAVCFFDEWYFSLRRLMIYGAAASAGYMAMLAFAKFNRRYFEESIMALLLETNSRNSTRPLPSIARLR